MRSGDPRDPLLLQVLARPQELDTAPGYLRDPVGDTAGNPRPGIIQKYRGRALLIASGSCAVHCRYCFRRHFPYGANQNSRAGWRDALEYLADDPEISEVILSGGDPLVANDAQLAQLVAQVAAIGHVRRLRVHSRLPVVIPQRVTTGLLEAISHPRLQTVMVIHSNHANELDAGVRAAVAALARRGITTLNQAVLLAGVNDSVEGLAELSEALFATGVLPYYLHLLDPVQGAAHFDVPEARARALHAGLAARLPGYLVPRLVREVTGAPAKRVLGA
jgi:EF-P beta-lysylation protein EpmB